MAVLRSTGSKRSDRRAVDKWLTCNEDSIQEEGDVVHSNLKTPAFSIAMWRPRKGCQPAGREPVYVSRSCGESRGQLGALDKRPDARSIYQGAKVYSLGSFEARSPNTSTDSKDSISRSHAST